MTNIQFAALAKRLGPHAVTADLRQLLRNRRPVRGATCDEAVVNRWLINGWSTEQLLVTNSQYLSGDALRHSLHWAFPQAYYSVFAVTLAYFKAVGYTEVSHTAVIRKFGTEAEGRRYPQALACTANGTTLERTFLNLAPAPLETSITFHPDDGGTVDGQIAQFLGATRDLDLQEKKKDIRILTATGTRKKAFTTPDWGRVSHALGPTSLLSLLYRKRIKANYRDIDSFLHDEINAEALYSHLLRIVGATNFVHEVFLACSMSCETLERVITNLPEGMSERPSSRIQAIRELVA